MKVLLRGAGKGFVVFLLTIITSFAIANKQAPRANVWYFGDKAGLDFNQGHPVALTDGAMSAFEGTGTICDLSGRLLFYTNGGDLPYSGGVWNRNHQLMPNGDMSGAGGCSSSFQSSLILNHPKYEHLYYLFTTDCIENNSAGGLRYSIVDMNLDGGLGDVLVKGQLLTTPVDESLTAIQHSNGRDFWVISHKIHTDSFYVYHFSDLGITGLVKTRIGPVTPDYAGSLKASTNGQKLVYSGLNFTSLFSFDNKTGIISNYVNVGIPSYSGSFSANCKVLYIANGVNQTLYQLDLSKNDFVSTAIEVGTTASTGFGGMQLGPDGRIYIARFVTSNYLGVIMQPDYVGVDCNYVDNGIYLAGKFGKGGLPNFPNNMVGECVPYPEENVSVYERGQLGLRLGNVTGNGFTAYWNQTGDNDLLYRVSLKNPRSKEWEEHVVHGNSISLNRLDSETTYELKVQRVIDNHGSYEFMDNHYTDKVIGTRSGTVLKNDNSLSVTTLKEFEFNLYPNPATTSSTIAMNIGGGKNPVDIILMEMNGKIIGEYNLNNVSGNVNFKLPTENLVNGIYNVAVQSGDNYLIKKLVVMK